MWIQLSESDHTRFKELIWIEMHGCWSCSNRWLRIKLRERHGYWSCSDVAAVLIIDCDIDCELTFQSGASDMELFWSWSYSDCWWWIKVSKWDWADRLLWIELSVKRQSRQKSWSCFDMGLFWSWILELCWCGAVRIVYFKFLRSWRERSHEDVFYDRWLLIEFSVEFQSRVGETEEPDVTSCKLFRDFVLAEMGLCWLELE